MGECIDLFGVERCLMESNLPVDSITLNPQERWEHLWAAVQGRGLTDEQLELLFRGNCLRYYSIGETPGLASTRGRTADGHEGAVPSARTSRRWRFFSNREIDEK